jgi:hypothetical protein
MSIFIDCDSVWRDRQQYPNPMDYQLTAKDIETWTRSGRTVRSVPQNPNERPLDFASSIEIRAASLPYPRIELFATESVVVDSVDTTATLFSVDPTGLAVGDVVMTSTPFGLSGINRNVQYWVIATPTPTSFQVSLTQGGPQYTQLVVGGPGLNIELSIIPPADYDTIMAQLNEALLLLTYPRIYLDFHCNTYKDAYLIRTAGGRLADSKFILFQERIQLDDRQTPVWIHYICRFEQVMRFKRDDVIALRFFTRGGSTIEFFNEPNLDVPTNPLKQSILTFEIKPYLRDAAFVHHSADPIQ